MPASSASEWLTATAIGTGAFVPIALTILSTDHDLRPRMPHVSLTPAVEVAERAVLRARLTVAAWLLVLAWHLEPQGGSR